MASKPARFLSFLFSTTPAPRPPAPATPDARTRCPAFPLSPTRSRGAPAPPARSHQSRITFPSLPSAPAFRPRLARAHAALGSGRHGPHCMALCGALLSWLPPISLCGDGRKRRGTKQNILSIGQISGTSKRLFCQGLEPPLFRSDLFWGVC
ncbi:hypothetical protein C8J57DRAFT_1533095 [Mycena rebaudengoi]|nr:hypothetical protein C8J57DRAFT_1533095 [Mycena rebaudengoi]